MPEKQKYTHQKINNIKIQNKQIYLKIVKIENPSDIEILNEEIATRKNEILVAGI